MRLTAASLERVPPLFVERPRSPRQPVPFVAGSGVMFAAPSLGDADYTPAVRRGGAVAPREHT